MKFVSARGTLAALAMVAACGSAQAFTAKGNYDVTFTVPNGGAVQYRLHQQCHHRRHRHFPIHA